MRALRLLLDRLRINVEIALVALRTSLLRSILTTLGVTIGVLSVILAVAVGEGAKVSVSQSINALGSNMALVFPQPDTRGRRRSSDRGRLTERDAIALQRFVPGVTAIAPQLRVQAQLGLLGRHTSTTVIGVTPDYSKVANIGAESGRFIAGSDIRSASRVIVLGRTVASRLFAGSEPLGQTVRVNRVPMSVVGILEGRGSSFGQDNDDLALVPITTARQRFPSNGSGPDDVSVLFVGLEPTSDLGDAKRRMAEVLKARNHVGPGDVAPFTITTTEEFTKQTALITNVFQAVLVAIASISLLVGGIGIMNIMLVSVAERTREIGLRMALGARPADIRNQFLTEAAVLCIIGGTVGVTLAAVLARVFERVADFPAPIGAGTVAGAILFSAFVGLLFGSYPAIRAAGLSPIEALRSE